MQDFLHADEKAVYTAQEQNEIRFNFISIKEQFDNKPDLFIDAIIESQIVIQAMKLPISFKKNVFTKADDYSFDNSDRDGEVIVYTNKPKALAVSSLFVCQILHDKGFAKHEVATEINEIITNSSSTNDFLKQLKRFYIENK